MRRAELIIYLILFLSLLFSYTSLYGESLVDKIIAENQINFDKIITFQADIEIKIVYPDDLLIHKGHVYFRKSPSWLTKVEYEYATNILSSYDTTIQDTTRILFLKDGEIIKEREVGLSGNCSSCASNNMMSSVFTKDINNYDIISITSNAGDYIISAEAKDNSMEPARKVYIIEKNTYLLKQVIGYNKEKAEIMRMGITYRLIDNIWVPVENRDEAIFSSDGEKAITYFRFKNIQINKPIADSIFRY